MRQRATRLSATGNARSLLAIVAEYLVAAGGGGGGVSVVGNRTGGGGGGGGVATGDITIPKGAAVTVTVGAGGAQRVQGSNSILDGIVAGGGGFGGTAVGWGGSRDRGSAGTGGVGIAAGGGGGGAAFEVVGGSAGGTGTQRNGGNGATTATLGIGGAGGGAGGDASSSGSISTQGVGIASTITGMSVTYGEGGRSHNGSTPAPNTGRGGNPNGYGDPQAAAGVVVIAYPDSYPALTVAGGLTFDQPVRAGFRVYRFTAGSGTISF